VTPTGPRTVVPDQALLDAARGGDEAAFERLLAPYRGELHAHCYRMLGSLHDTEDAMQEALLRVWRNLGSLADRAALRAWLYRIATNACLDLIARRKRRLLPYEYAPAADPDQPPGEPVPGRSGSSPTRTRRSGSRTVALRPTPTTSSAMRSSSPSSPRCSTCRPASGRC
jgi:RNA polymerase sigma factor (sigma-70 family)